MPKGSDNPYPSVLIVEGSAPADPASGDQRLFVDSSDHLLKLVDSSGTVTTVGGSGMTNPMTTLGDVIVGGASGAAARLGVGSDGQVLTADSGSTDGIKWAAASGSPLAVHSYAPASDGTIYTATTTSALADSTNLAVTFTAPASTNVFVKFTGIANTGGSGSDQYWELWESTSRVGTNTRKAAGVSFFGSVVAAFYVTGISAGSHTYKWAVYKTTGTSLLSGGPTYGAAVMEVWAA